MKIYHNPRCSKSRETLKLIEDANAEVTIIEYLKTPPSREELETIIQQLGIEASQLIRKGEADFKDNFKGKTLSESEWIDAMVAYPKLIERPIVIKDQKAVIGRPPELVLDLIG